MAYLWRGRNGYDDRNVALDNCGIFDGGLFRINFSEAGAEDFEGFSPSRRIKES